MRESIVAQMEGGRRRHRVLEHDDSEDDSEDGDNDDSDETKQ